ncbi:MAG: hypothetical protein U9N50_02025 [Pseudomonadota bacterium]|nr:hypothetical protein [Pseudomonadota bacterium]
MSAHTTMGPYSSKFNDNHGDIYERNNAESNGKMMSGMMKPEGMPHMMETMMDSVFKEMATEDRVGFMQNMMPRCMSMMFSELEPEARKDLAGAMLNRMVDELKGQLDN